MADEKRKTTAAADLHPRPITPAHEPQDSGSDDTETATGPQRVGTHELSEKQVFPTYHPPMSFDNESG